MNGLDPTVWGQFAEFGIVPTSEREWLLDLLGKAQELLAAIYDGQNCSDEAGSLHDDIASAAIHYGWWMDDAEQRQDL